MEKKSYTTVVPFPSLVELKPIGRVHSPYKERHGTPRQASVINEGGVQRGTIEIFSDFVPPRALRDLEGFEYLWVIAWFHLNKNWNPMVAPPRGKGKKRGVLATRAPHRPNSIGLSAVRLIEIKGNIIEIEALDLLDGTPVLDIKPYIPYADAFPDASAGWVDALSKTEPS